MQPAGGHADIDVTALGHARMVMEAMLVDGQVVPLLGAGVNLCGGPRTGVATWRVPAPNGQELAALGAQGPGLPADGAERPGCASLSASTSSVAGKRSTGRCTSSSTPTIRRPSSIVPRRDPELIATLERPPRESHLLIVTTNYDDVLERAFTRGGRAVRPRLVRRPRRRRRQVHAPAAGRRAACSSRIPASTSGRSTYAAVGDPEDPRRHRPRRRRERQLS